MFAPDRKTRRGGFWSGQKYTSFFGLGICMFAFADLLAELILKAAFFLYRERRLFLQNLAFAEISSMGIG
jgi:hypothetical protein